MGTERLHIEVSESGARTVKRNIEDIGKAGEGAERGVDNLKRALEFLGLALTLGEALRQLSEFSQKMALVSAISGATGDRLANLGTQARRLGAETGAGAVSAAGALVQLERASLATADAVGPLEDSLRLAEIAGVDAATAATALGRTLGGFKLDVREAEKVVDVFATATLSSTVDIDQLGAALKQAGPASRAAGVSFEGTTAALLALAQAGQIGRFAGAGLKGALQELQAPSRQVTDNLRAFGVSVAEVQPSSVGLVGALRRLKDAGIDSTTAMEIFGEKAGLTISTLIEGLPEYEKFAERLDRSAGAGARAAAILENSLHNALQKLRASAGSAAIALGQASGISGVIIFLASHVEILGGVMVALAITQIPRLLSALTALEAALATHPIGLLAVVIAGAIGALISFRHELGLDDEALRAIALAFEDVIRFAGATVATMRGLFTGALATILATISKVPAAFGDVVLGAINLVIRAINTLVEKATAGINALLAEVFKFQYAYGLTNLERPFQIGIGRLEELKNPLAGAAGDLGNTAGDAFLEGFDKSFNETMRKVDDFVAGLRGGRASTPSAAGAAPETETGGGGADVKRAAIAADVLRARVALTRELGDANVNLSVTYQALNSLVLAGTVTREDANRKLAEEVLKVQQFKSATDTLAATFNAVDTSAGTLGATIGQDLVGAIDSASGALADFAISGFKNFDDLKKAGAQLLQDLGKQILQLIIKTLILKAIQASLNAFGGGGGLANSAVGTSLSGGLGGSAAITSGLAGGGDALAGRTYLVGERGPELFTPPTTGRVVPNGQLSGAVPEVNIKNVVTFDRGEMIAAMQSSEGEKVVMTHVTKNRRALQGLAV